MLKRDELSNPDSCWNRAGDAEFVFVLLGRDQSLPAAVRGWIKDRITRGKNRPTDAEILSAAHAILLVERSRSQMVTGEVSRDDILREVSKLGAEAGPQPPTKVVMYITDCRWIAYRGDQPLAFGNGDKPVWEIILKGLVPDCDLDIRRTTESRFLVRGDPTSKLGWRPEPLDKVERDVAFWENREIDDEIERLEDQITRLRAKKR